MVMLSGKRRYEPLCQTIDLGSGTIAFENGAKNQHDLIIGAGGIESVTRKIINLDPKKQLAKCSCLHDNVMSEYARELGLVDHSLNGALEY
jgi:2-polyprenyl-6-methoxyphenol hydroxylase-like FAD-dependent oxidoreductase